MIPKHKSINPYITQVTPSSALLPVNQCNSNISYFIKNHQNISNKELYYIASLFKSLESNEHTHDPHREHFIITHQFFRFIVSETSSIALSPPPIPYRARLPPPSISDKTMKPKKSIIFDLD